MSQSTFGLTAEQDKALEQLLLKGKTGTTDGVDAIDLEDKILAETARLSEDTATSKITTFPTNKDYYEECIKEKILKMFESPEHISEHTERSSVDTKEMGNIANFSDYTTTADGHQKRKDGYNSPQTGEQAESQAIYQTNTYVDENGITQNCNEVAMKVDTSKFDFDFDSDSEESAINNVETLKALYSNIVKKKVGGFDRVTSILVSNGRVIFNKNIFVNIKPLEDKDKINFRDHLPLDLYEYIRQGMTGYFFDWSLLLRCRNLRSLVFDDFDFVTDIVAVDLNMSYVREDYFFTYLRQLKYLKMGEYEYTDKLPETAEEKAKAKQQRIAAAREQSFLGRAKEYYSKSTFDYGRLKPTNWTDKLDNHFHRCFKDYLKNRGKKGLIRYTGGVIIRGIFAAASTLLNAGTHFVGDSVSYVSQYKPRVAEDPEWGIKYTTWDYTPNKRTSNEKPKFTSGDDVVNNMPSNTTSDYADSERKAQRTYSGKSSYNKGSYNKGSKYSKGTKSSSSSKKDKFEVEDEDA